MNRSRKRVCLIVLAVLFLLSAIYLAVLHSSGSWLLSILQWTDYAWTPPAAFEGFHLAFLAACVLISIGFAWLGMRIKAYQCDTLVFGAGCLLFVLEVYKQYYSFFVMNDRVYDFGFLPLQLCSLPLYLFLLTPLLPEGALKEAFYRFLAFFATMGGCLVMVYPAFYDRLSLCIHTMVWHTVMISIGVMILFARGYGKSWRREMPSAVIVFIASVLLATLMNVLLRPLAYASPNPLNLLYMSPYEKTYFVLIRDVQRTMGWLPSMLCYVLLFIFVGATLVFLVAYVIQRLRVRAWNFEKRGKKQENI